MFEADTRRRHAGCRQLSTKPATMVSWERTFSSAGSISISRCAEQPGLYEVPFGATLGDLLDMAGGVRGGRDLQTVLLGGAAGVFVKADELGLPLTFEDTRASGTTLGSGVIMVFDDTIDLKPI